MLVVPKRVMQVIAGFAVAATGVGVALVGAQGAAAQEATTSAFVKQSTVSEYQGCAGTGGAYFVITKITAPPESIDVLLSNGDSVTAPLVKAPGKTAHYSYTFASAVSVRDARAEVPEGWSGQFNISHCLSGSPTTSGAPTSGGGGPVMSTVAAG